MGKILNWYWIIKLSDADINHSLILNVFLSHVSIRRTILMCHFSPSVLMFDTAVSHAETPPVEIGQFQQAGLEFCEGYCSANKNEMFFFSFVLWFRDLPFA